MLAAFSGEATVLTFKKIAAALVGLGVFCGGSASATGPTEGGTAPHLSLRLSDPATFDVRAPSLTPTTTEVTGEPLVLVIRNNAEGYRVITNNPLPSSWVGDYRLNVTTTDGDGVPGSREWIITYAPNLVEVTTASSGELWIPAVNHSFKSGARLNPITTAAWKLPNGTLLLGGQELRVSMHKDSTVPLTVGGVQIKPGDVGIPLGTYDFTAAASKLSLPLTAVEHGVEGQARIWITTTASGSPAVDVTIKTWTPKTQLLTNKTTLLQAFDVFEGEVQQVEGSRCTLTVSEREAKDSDTLTAPKCLVEWDSVPTDLKKVTSTMPLVKGRMWTNGSFALGYRLSLVDVSGVKIPFATETLTLTVNPLGDALSYTPIRDTDKVYRLVQPVDVMMKQSAGPACDTYASFPEDEYRSSDTLVRCSFTWMALPANLAQNPWWVRPYLKGSLDNEGVQTVGWKVHVVTPLGAKIPAGQGSFTYDVIEPPAPTISEDMLNPIRDGLYAVSREGGYAGNVEVRGANAAYHVTVERGSEVVDDSDFEAAPWGLTRIIPRRINAVESELWSQTPWTVSAFYTLMSGKRADRIFMTLAVPSENIKPVISIPSTQVLDTMDLNVAVSIRDIYKPELGYDASKMGEWKVRLVKYIDYKTIEPLTDYMDATGGEASFVLPASDLGRGYVRLTAEASLVSPVPEYVRTEFSPRPLSLSILKGGPIEADLTGRRVSGEAPLTTVLSVALENRLDATALGDVIWQISADNGSSWTTHSGQRFNKMRLVHTFMKGEYLVRATLKNKFSEAEHVTETIQVVAFDIPKAKLEGPEHIFIGGTGHYRLKLAFGGVDLPDDRVAVEWSLDAGKSFQPGGTVFDVSRDREARMVLVARARMVEAPADAPDAWRIVRRRVNFVSVRPPNVRIIGPARVEYPLTGEFRGIMGPPYRNMDVQLRGWWDLPAGAREDGSLLTWGPRQEDLAETVATLHYSAEIVGYEGTRNTEDKRVRVWEYSWPEFKLEPTRTSQYAPANVTLRVRQIGRPVELDKPVVAWTLPSAAMLLEDTNPLLRVVETPTAGIYPFSAAISDARGNASTVNLGVNMLQAPNYVMSLSTNPSNPYNRAPLEVVVRPTITGGHPNDRIASMGYLLDGQPTGQTGSYVRMKLTEGTHTVEAQATTQMGWTFGAAQTLTVVANQPPSCTVATKEWTGGWMFYATCQDADGRVVQYRWMLDGERVEINSARISVSRFGRTDPPLVTLTGVDDAGADSVTVTADTETTVEPPQQKASSTTP